MAFFPPNTGQADQINHVTDGIRADSPTDVVDYYSPEKAAGVGQILGNNPHSSLEKIIPDVPTDDVNSNGWKIIHGTAKSYGTEAKFDDIRKIWVNPDGTPAVGIEIDPTTGKPLAEATISSDATPSATPNNAGTGSVNTASASAGMSRTIGMPNEEESKSVNLNQETITQSIGKAIIAFLNNIGIPLSSVEGQNVAFNEGNDARTTGGVINQSRALNTVEKVTGIDPKVLALALPEQSVFKSFNMANANQNTVKSQIVGTQQQAEIVASR
jgi:hypothetical protein